MNLVYKNSFWVMNALPTNLDLLWGATEGIRFARLRSSAPLRFAYLALRLGRALYRPPYFWLWLLPEPFLLLTLLYASPVHNLLCKYAERRPFRSSHATWQSWARIPPYHIIQCPVEPIMVLTGCFL